MNQSIRQQTAIRSPLVTTARRGLAKPAKLPVKRIQPKPLGFLIDGTACTDEVMRFPRTTREAFGPYSSDRAPARITFLSCHRGGWCGIAAVVLLLAAAIGWSVR